MPKSKQQRGKVAARQAAMGTAAAKPPRTGKAPPGVLPAVEDLRKLVEDNVRWSVAEATCHVELDAALARLRKLQHDTRHYRSLIPRRTPESFQAFTAWLTEQGLDLDTCPFRIRFAAGEPGDNATLFATRDIPKDELILRVSGSLIMAPDLSPETPVGRLVAAFPGLSEMPSITLAVTLLLEAANPKSRFSLYIGILPGSFTIPFGNFSAADIAALRPSVAASSALRSLRAQIRNYALVYTALHRLRLPELPVSLLSLDNFIWAVSIVMTRQNAIPVRNPAPLALVPVWDMCNHEPGPHTTSVSITEDGDVLVESRAMRMFKVGEPITMFYGARPNVQLLQFSGFVQPDNAHDSVPIRQHLAADMELAAFKAKVVLGKAGFPVREQEDGRGWVVSVDVDASADSAARALSVARVMVMSKEGIGLLLKSGDVLPKCPLENDLEEASAHELLRSTLQDAVREYGLSEESCDHKMSPLAKGLIAKLHAEEKKLLRRVISAISDS